MKRETILIIDDEESMRDSCSLILKKDGYNIESAEDGNRGLEKIKTVKPDLVLIDLKMPGLSGFEVLDEVKLIDPEIIPVVITGYATVESAVEAMKRGAYDFLPKPFTPQEFRIIIKRGLERKKLAQEAEMLRSEKKLIEENFITMVSHQLRSPLVAILQYFEVLLGGMVGDIQSEQRAMILKAQNRLEKLLELINDWLDVARMNSGTIVEKRQPILLRDILKKLVEFMRPTAEENGIQLHLQPPGGQDSVMGDPESLEQVFTNLISNAIKYNRPEGSVTISTKEEDTHIVVTVSDTGMGIPEEHLPFIFDQFYRVHRTENQRNKGSGLGLTIAKKIVEAHEGAIEVSSEEGIGSVFTVRLPAAAAPSTHAE